MKRLRIRWPSSTTILSLAAVVSLLILATVLPGCGGVDSGGTGQTVDTTAQGRVTGFGSVFVNGVRYDDSSAVVVDDDGATRSRADLQLGMLVQVQGELRGNSGQGVARRIQFGPEIAGPVEAVDAPNAILTVLGQSVRVDADTLFGGYAAGLADVQAGHLVEVHAFYDAAASRYTATRIERRATMGRYVLRGQVANLAALPARTFTLGAAAIDYGAVSPASLPTLANGLAVRVLLNTTPVSGHWVASAVQASQPPVADQRAADLEGHVSAFQSSASFRVAGMPVDASAPGVTVRRGTLADLADGVRVEVEGTVRNGVLVASRVSFKRGGDDEFELHGEVESVDVAAQTLVVRGVSVAWDGSTVFAAGTAAGLAPGAAIEVKGAPTGGVRIQARSIRFER